MPKKKTSSKSPKKTKKAHKAKNVERQVYKDCEIEVEHFDVEQKLLIDKKEVKHSRDADSGTYHSPDLPYHTFGSLQEIAEAIIDAKEG